MRGRYDATALQSTLYRQLGYAYSRTSSCCSVCIGSADGRPVVVRSRRPDRTDRHDESEP